MSVEKYVKIGNDENPTKNVDFDYFAPSEHEYMHIKCIWSIQNVKIYLLYVKPLNKVPKHEKNQQ